jgi:phosphatidylinositol glycan class B
VLGLTCLLDRFMYGSWILVPLNFLKFNFLSSGGDYYGTHKWHWYFTQGFTVMIFSHIPFCIAGIIYSKQWKFSGLLAWVLCFYSILGHKEFKYFNLNNLHMHVYMAFWFELINDNTTIYICM